MKKKMKKLLRKGMSKNKQSIFRHPANFYTLSMLLSTRSIFSKIEIDATIVQKSRLHYFEDHLSPNLSERETITLS
jgi:hypothetical protein